LPSLLVSPRPYPDPIPFTIVVVSYVVISVTFANLKSSKTVYLNRLFTVQLPGVCFEKSKRRAIERLLLSSSSGEASLRLRFILLALTVGPVELSWTLPSTSSSGRAVIWVVHFGSLEGKVG